MPRRLYPAIVHSDDGKTFGVSFVDFPVHAGGNSVEAAIADAEIVVGEAVDALVESGASLPRPTAVSDIPADDRDGGEAIALIPTRVGSRYRPHLQVP